MPHVARAGSIWEAGAAPFEPLEVQAPEGNFAFLVVTAADTPNAFAALGEGPLHSDADLRRLLAALRAEAKTPMAVSALHYQVQASE